MTEIPLEGIFRDELLDAVDQVAAGYPPNVPPVVFLLGSDGRRCAAIVQADVGEAAERAWDDLAGERAARCVTSAPGQPGGICDDAPAMHRHSNESKNTGPLTECLRVTCPCKRYTPRGPG